MPLLGAVPRGILTRAGQGEVEVDGMGGSQTVYLQGDDALALERGEFHCERCLVSLDRAYSPDRFGNYEVFGDFDARSNLVGFLCPRCAAKR
ncbi:MAG: hypothetical protein AB1816_11830 [Bacillota bacterium]